jgi:hypothetical protein
MIKNSSNRVSAKTIEETYTDLDVFKNDEDKTDISLNYMPNTGFTFDYPQRWLNEENEFKAIGVRRLNVVPSSHTFTLLFDIKWKCIRKSEYSLEEPFRHQLTITAENSFEEIIHKLIAELNAILRKIEIRLFDEDGVTISGYLGNYATFTYSFDYKTGKFTLKLSREAGVFEKLQFKVEGDSKTDLAVNNLNHFLRFMNQKQTDANRKKLTDYTGSKTFYRVWDRVSLQFHASFSNNKRNFIGLNNDFYTSPSVFYDGPTNASDFWIKFTTDGRHQFLPRYCRFYIGISFVRNYKNSLVTK